MRRKPDPEAPESAAGGAAERIVAATLLLIVLLLAYVRFVVLREPATPASLPFDLRNPMLDARVGECHELEDSGSPGTVSCIVVVEPGVVLRPSLGPERMGREYERLRRMPPYLACAARFPDPGKSGCAQEGGREEPLLFGLNQFGLPLGLAVEVVQIQPVLKKWQGREHQAYQVQMLRHGQMAGPWTLWMSEDAPVTGTIYREYSYARSHHRVIYREVEGCTPPH